MRCEPDQLCMMLDPQNYGRLCMTRSLNADTPGCWNCEALQTVLLTVTFGGERQPRAAGALFVAHDAQLQPFPNFGPADSDATDEPISAGIAHA